MFGRLDELSNRLDKLQQNSIIVVVLLVFAAWFNSSSMEARMDKRMEIMKAEAAVIRREDKAEAAAIRREDKAEAAVKKANMMKFMYATRLIAVAAIVIPALPKIGKGENEKPKS